MYKDFQLPRHSCIIIYQTQYIIRMGDWWKQRHIAAEYIDKQERVCWMTFTILALPSLAAEQLLVSLTFMNLHGLWSGGFSTTCAQKQPNHNKGLVGQQIIKVLTGPTNNAEQFCGQKKAGKFKCEHFTKFFQGFGWDFWSPQDYQLLIFYRLFQCGTINFILIKQ